LFAVGDIYLNTRNSSHPFKHVCHILKEKDILFGNLETVLSKNGTEKKKSVILKSSPDFAKYLKDVDFDVLNVANNHAMDLGIEGLKCTINSLDNYSLNYVGLVNSKNKQNSLILEKNGIKLGFLGYTIGRFKESDTLHLSKLVENHILLDIKFLQNKCDYIVISLHWGTENVFYPSPAQIELAHKLIDNGATLILGHHPHVVQGIEKYKHGLIAYSLGNFQFVNKLPRYKTNESIILSVELGKDGIVDYEIIPLLINKDFVPTLADKKEKENILEWITQISAPLLNRDITDKWWFEEIGSEYLLGNMRSYVFRIKKYGIMPFLECCIWLVTPFCIKCYAGIVRRNISKVFNGE